MNEQEDEGTGAAEVEVTKCNHLLYPVRNGQTTAFEYFECQLCGGQWNHHELQTEFARLREEAQQAVEARVARIVAALEVERDMYDSGDELNSPLNILFLQAFDDAIAIAREEG